MISPEMIGVLITASGGLVGLGVNWGKSQTLREDMDKKIDAHIQDDIKIESGIKAQLAKMWEWKDAHERDASNMRLELQKQIGKLETGLQVHDGQYNEIIRLIANMSETFTKKMDQLENSIKEIRK